MFSIYLNMINQIKKNINQKLVRKKNKNWVQNNNKVNLCDFIT